MEIRAEIINPFYDHGGRKYMDIKWDGVTYTVKVPFRYNRVMCKVEGLTPIQDYKAGQIILAFVEKKHWQGTIHFVLYCVREFTT
jgi:hypothetical protein